MSPEAVDVEVAEIRKQMSDRGVQELQGGCGMSRPAERRRRTPFLHSMPTLACGRPPSFREPLPPIVAECALLIIGP